MDWKLSKRAWISLAVVVVLLVVLLVMLSGRQPVARVAVVKAFRGNLSAAVASNGKVEPITPYALRAKLETFVDQVMVVEGQAVKRGQVLLVLNADDARAQLAQAKDNLAAAQDDLRVARAGGPADAAAQIDSDLRKAEIERTRLRREREALERLVAKQAATKEELAHNQVQLERTEADLQRYRKAKEELQRKAILDVERATLRVERSREQLRALEEKVRSAHLTAPVDGTLYSLPVHQRDFVKMGDLLVELADLHRVRVRAFIDEPELGGLEPGQHVEITWDALPNRMWTGQTEQIPKQVVARASRSVGEVLCSVQNDKLELLPNTNVNIRIYMKQRQNALEVPRGAVLTEGNHRYVFVVDAGLLGVERSRLEKREIRVGIASATSYEVLDGLRDGEPVALPGDVELKDGMTVRVVSG